MQWAGFTLLPDPMSTYRLHYAPDNASLIIRLALEEMRLPYETVLVDRSIRAQSSPNYLKLNPNGLIPVLEVPENHSTTQDTPPGYLALFETGAILLWLADTHKSLAPFPDSPDRGQFLTWLFFVSNTLHADLRISFYPHLFAGEEKAGQTRLQARMRARLATHLGLLEDLALSRPGWLGADDPSVLDYYLAGLMRWMALYPKTGERNWFDLNKLSALDHMLSRLETRPAVKAAQDAEGLGPTPFTRPTYATPPEGSAT